MSSPEKLNTLKGADCAGSGTADPAPLFTLLAAVLARLTAAMGVFWMLTALFGGTDAAAGMDLVPPPVMWAAMIVCFAALHWFLTKGRPLLLVLIVCLLLSAAAGIGVSRACQAENPICTGFYGAAFLFAMISQIRWETGTLRDGTMMTQVQVLLLFGICQIWLAGQLQLHSPWIPSVFAAAAISLCGLIVSKTSGLRSNSSGGPGGSGSRGGIAAAAAVLCGLLCVLAAALANPVGRAIAAGYGYAEGGLVWFLTAAGKFLGYLFTGSRVRLDETAQSSSGGGAAAGEVVSGGHGGGDVFRILFHIAVIAILAVLALALLRFLLQITIGAGRAAVRKRGSRIEKNGSLRERMAAFFRQLRQSLRAYRILHRNPDSVAALLVWLERRCRRIPGLQREPGETVRSFLLRLAGWVTNGQTGRAADSPGSRTAGCVTNGQNGRTADELSRALLHLADAADAACYGRDGNRLAAFPESGVIRKGMKSVTSSK